MRHKINKCDQDVASSSRIPFRRKSSTVSSLNRPTFISDELYLLLYCVYERDLCVVLFNTPSLFDESVKDPFFWISPQEKP